MSYVIITVFKILLNILYVPMKLRRKEDKIVFLSRQSDTPSVDIKLLSEELYKLSPNTKQVMRLKTVRSGWKEKILYALHLLGDMWHLGNASIAICDTYSIPVSCLRHKKNLYIIQMWHALGATKKFGLQSLGKREGRNERVSRALNMHKGYSCIFAPSKATAQFYEEAFGVEGSKIQIFPLPRVDYILKKCAEIRNEFMRRNPKYQGKKVVLYLPTFRENEEQIVESLERTFVKNDRILLITSLHPLSKIKRKVEEEYEGEYNTFDLMKIADVIITDYSASAFEGAILNKPLYFYIPDYLRYNNNRGLNVKLNEEMRGYTYTEAEELLKAIQENNYIYHELVQFRNKYVENTRNCTKNMAQYILKMKG